jgi:membrane fusion protein (multidrug efflux system)
MATYITYYKKNIEGRFMVIKWLRNMFICYVLFINHASLAKTNDLSVHLQGVVMPAEQINFSFGQSGILLSIAKNGHQLTVGDVVAELDNTRAKVELEKSDALVRAAEAKLASAEHARDKSLRLVKEDILSNIAVIEANFEVTSSIENLAVAHSEQKLAKQNLKQHVIIAPFSGAIINAKVHQGEWINAAEPFITLVNFKNLSLSIDIPPKMGGSLAPDMITNVMLDAKVVGIAKVKTIFPIVDPASGLLRVTWQILPIDGKLLSGRYVALQPWNEKQNITSVQP